MKRDIFLSYYGIFRDRNWINLSNFFTSIRIFLAPGIVYEMYYKNWSLAFWFFILGALTDLLDGYFARLLEMQTYLGKVLDPIADKIFLISSFLSLSFISTPSFHIPAWFTFFMIFREFIILTGSAGLMVFKGNFEIQPILWGKLTTLFQIIFIVWIFSCYFFNWVPLKTYYVVLMLLAFYSFVSLIQYVKLGASYFKC